MHFLIDTLRQVIIHHYINTLAQSCEMKIETYKADKQQEDSLFSAYLLLLYFIIKYSNPTWYGGTHS